MKTLEQILDILDANHISIDKYEENEKLCGYELNTYTQGGVNQIIFLDFRDKGNPNKASDFVKKFSEYVEEIDIDDEITTNRQNEKYRKDFTLRESLEDFEYWQNELKNIVELITNNSEEEELEPNFNYQDLDEENKEDLLKWFNNDELFALIDDEKGGIIGYIHHSHIDRICGKLNQTKI